VTLPGGEISTRVVTSNVRHGPADALARPFRAANGTKAA
jgi:hypothetical protein